MSVKPLNVDINKKNCVNIFKKSRCNSLKLSKRFLTIVAAKNLFTKVHSFSAESKC